MSRSFAFFDLDHTLLPFDTQTLFCNYVLHRERWRMGWHVAFAPFAVLRACRMASTVTAKRAFLNYLRGMKRGQLMRYAADFAEQVVKPWIYPDLLAILSDHRRAGRILVLNTASPDFYAREIARVLDFDYCIATRMDLPEALPFLPRVIGLNNKREAKIAAMKDSIPQVAAADEAVLRDSWSYSDSSADLPLLEFAGHAVLVHPSPGLAALGKSRGWPILLPARPYTGRTGDMISALQQVLGIYSRKPPATSA